MTPHFYEFIIKIASRCNLDCTYCYEYNLGDETWRRNAKFMSEQTIQALASGIRKHALAHDIREVFVNFHGGEPLLAGHKRLDMYASILKKAAGNDFAIHLGMQTNAILVNEQLCDVLVKHDIDVSISLDGGKLANDRHRIDHQGKSSYEATLRGMHLLRKQANGRPGGILSVVDTRNDPLEVFDALAELGIQNIDFLLPHYNWDRLPPRYSESASEYGEWLYAIFDAWVGGRHTQVDIRFFRNILLQFIGLSSSFEVMNLGPVQLVTVNTDGDIEAVDTLKSTASGAQQTGLNVMRNTFDDALREQIIAVRQSGVEQLCPTCQECKFMRECAGGYFPHRYSRKNKFNNPSVYCKDLYWLLDQIKNRFKISKDRKREIIQAKNNDNEQKNYAIS